VIYESPGQALTACDRGDATIGSASAATHYADGNSANPTPPYTNWAFSVIQTNIPGQVLETTFTDTNDVGLGPFFYRVGVQQ